MFKSKAVYQISQTRKQKKKKTKKAWSGMVKQASTKDNMLSEDQHQ